MLPYSQGPADVLTRILAGEGITVWALGCSAKCWHTQLCLEMVLQRMLPRSEFFWKLLGQGNTWGVAGLIYCCFWHATGTLPGSCWCHWLHVRAATAFGWFSHMGSWAEQIFRSLNLTSALSCPWGGQGFPGSSVLGALLAQAGEGLAAGSGKG